VKGLVLRVQLGAYHKPLSKKIFADIGDLMEVKTQDGLHKYMTGVYKTFEEAAKRKVDLQLAGYEGAFITAYQDGKRVKLQEAGATLMEQDDVLEETSDNVAISGVSKKLVTFKVQVGAYKNDPPADKMEKFAKLKNLTGDLTRAGLNRYTIGPFVDYQQAEAAKEDMIKNYGLSDAFIIAFFNEESISIQEALELLK
jgi:cell division protein FtsN